MELKKLARVVSFFDIYLVELCRTKYFPQLE